MRLYISPNVHPIYVLPAPSPPRMLTTTGAPTGTVVELNWLPSLHPNGAIHYEIEYNPAKTPGDPVNAGNTSNLYFTLTLSSDLLSYNVRVAAVNNHGRAESSDLLVTCLGTERGMLLIAHNDGVL